MAPEVSSAPVRRIIAWLADLVFPPHCGGCGRLGEWFCAACVGQIGPPTPAGWACGGCTDRPWGRCRQPGCADAPLAGLLVLGAFEGPLREAIHAFKYGRQRVLAPALARLLVGLLDVAPAPWGCATPVLLAVPLHRQRVRERDFSQTATLATALASRTGYSLLTGLVRTRHTPPQVGLQAADRRANMVGAFAWSAGVRPPQRPVLLIDDVYTSGATMRAAAQALHEAGAGPVYGLALARPRTV